MVRFSLSPFTVEQSLISIKSVDDHTRRGTLCSIHSDHTLGQYYERLFRFRSPFASLTSTEGQFIGNIWGTALQEYHSHLNVTEKMGSIIERLPVLLEKEHFLRANDPIPLKLASSTNFHVFPVLDAEQRILGSIDLLDVISNNISPSLYSKQFAKIQNVLIVDDEESISSILKEGLEKRGHKCFTAKNGREALELWTSTPQIQLILTDINMPVMNGEDLILHVRNVDLEIPIIVLTGYSDKQSALRCMRLGANDIQDKPYEMELIFHTISRYDRIAEIRRKELHNRTTENMLSYSGTLMSKSDESFLDKMQGLVTRLAEVLSCRYVSIVLLNEAKKLEVLGSTKKEIKGRSLQLDDSALFAKVYKDKLPLITRTLLDISKYKNIELYGSYESSTCFILPLTSKRNKGDVIGFISCSDKLNGSGFDEFDFGILESLSQSLSLQIEYCLLLESFTNLNRNLEVKAAEQAQTIIRNHNELQQYSRLALLGETAASIAHDIKNPLCVAINYAQRLRNESSIPSEERLQAVEKLNISLSRINQITSNVSRMAFSNSSTAKIQSFAIMNAISNGLLMLEQKLMKHSVKVNIISTIDLKVNGHQVQIEQVIMNLISNAIDALSKQNEKQIEIEVTASVKFKNISVSVRDNGPGIDSEHSKKIFDKFYTTKTEGMGTGLGLHISKTIIEGHGGSLKHFRTKNNLTEFSFTLPIA